MMRSISLSERCHAAARRCRLSLAVVTCGLAALAFTGCENVQRSLVFSTGTTIGIEVSAKPQSDSPINLVIGYKRAEVLLDPIMTDRADANNGNTKRRREYDILAEPHSVIAKLIGSAEGSSGASAEGKTTVSQWFASGKAAEILAANGAAAVLTENPGISAATARALEAVRTVPSVDVDAQTALTPIREKWLSLRAQRGNLSGAELAALNERIERFDRAAQQLGYTSFADLASSESLTSTSVSTLRQTLEQTGEQFD